ncbi:MAG: basic amino acid/polyamine antiporter [Muribaculaceae bacterium]|nr:basic amino acid/polyamine antiporter [Muribaculaceae bacterium]
MKSEETAAKEQRLGLTGLAALVFGMMVGSGIFNIPQNMAAGAGLGAVMIGWIITAAGMLMLVNTFKILADRHPELNEGIYLYAEKGFGRIVGFNIAWGYWLCACFANIAYAVMLNDTFGAFFPSLLAHGVPTVLFCSALIWLMFFLISSGIRTSSIIATGAAIMKVCVIILIIVLLAVNIRYDTLTTDIFSQSDGIGGITRQVKSTMLVTLWCFIGIEGAVVMSGRARRQSDVGKAGIIGFLSAWILYVLVSVFCFGIMTRARLAGLEDPSVAYALKSVCGEWAYWLVIIAVIISITGGWFAWTLVTAEQPYSAARHGIFPRRLINKREPESLRPALLASSVIMQAFLFLVIFAEDIYLYALNITGMMILPAYFFSGLFLVKMAVKDYRSRPLSSPHARKDLASALLTGTGCTVFCIWMLYAAGLDMLMQAFCFFLAGLPLYRRKNTSS